jgi:hypothetical protein
VTITRGDLYQNSQTLTHAAGVLPGHSLQKRAEVQWDIGAALGADDGADESTSPQVGISITGPITEGHVLINRRR